MAETSEWKQGNSSFNKSGGKSLQEKKDLWMLKNIHRHHFKMFVKNANYLKSCGIVTKVLP